MQNALVRKAARAAGFGALTVASGAAVYGAVRLAPLERKSSARDAVTGAWSRGLLSLFGVDARVSGASPGPLGVGRGRGRIVIANHRSIIDIALLLSTFGGAVLSRGDLAGWPIVGPAARAAGTVFVDRSSKASGARAIEAMVARLAEDDTISLFPEGTTFEDDEVRPFKPGAFVAAARARVPVVPVGLVYPLDSGAAFGGETFVEHLSRLAGTARTRAYVEVGEPLDLAPDESVDDFRERCRSEVARLVRVARAKERAEA